MEERFGSSYSVSELLVWSTEEYSTLRFSENFRSKLPVLCRVSGGYSGRDEAAHSLGQDEMFWTFEIFSQPRITVIDELNRQISVPIDYRFRFQIIGEEDNKPTGPPKRLNEIVSSLEPGFTRLMIENNKRVSFGLGADRKELSSLGTVRFKERRDIDFLIAYPLVEEFLHPIPVFLPTYVPAEMRVAQGFQYGCLADFKKFTNEMKKAVSRFSKLPTEICNDVIIFNDDSCSETESLYLYPSPDDDETHDDDEDYEEAGALPNETTDETPEIPTSSKPVAMRRNLTLKKEKPFPLPPMPRPLPLIETVPDKEVLITYYKHYDTGKVCSGKTLGAPPIPPRRPNGPSNSPFNERRRKRASDIQEAEEECGGGARSTPPPPPPIPPPPVQPCCSGWPICPDRKDDGGRERNRDRIDKLESQWRNAVDIPLYMPTFTIDEVCYCLQALNMEKYIEKFVTNHVDGELLISLSESILKETFDFTEFDAIKLMKFSRDGWRPRMNKKQEDGTQLY